MGVRRTRCFITSVFVVLAGMGFLGFAELVRILHAQDPISPLKAIEQQTIQVFKAVSPSVVYITNKIVKRDFFSLNVFEGPKGAGSGFVWDDQGHIVTNYHVIAGAQRLTVRMADDENDYPAVVVGYEPDKDLAVIRVDAPAARRTPVQQGDSATLQVGQTVLAIGNPFGLDHTLTKGIVSALGREIKALTGRTIRDVVQTDAAINPGNSGGPLLDFSGRLIGVNTMIYSPSGSSAGIGFAVPVNTVKRIVPQLIEHGKFIRPTLGVTLLPDAFSRRYQLKGLIIRDVLPRSGADLAGLKGLKVDYWGDWELGDVIVGVEGQPVSSLDELLHALERHLVGETVKISIVRDDRTAEVKVPLTATE